MQAEDPRIRNEALVRYTVQSSDVLSDMRLNVLQEGTDKVLWYKERYLAEDEIVENIVDNVTSTIHWTIHKPVKGWYIRLRSPSFPPGSFVSLLPAPTSSPYHSDAALIFSCRTNVPSVATRSSSVRRSSDSDTTLTGEAAVHSYPPTPPQNPVLRVSPPSPRSVQAKLSEISSPSPTQQITTFILTPHSHAHIPEQRELSVFARMMSALKNSAPSHSSSFTLSPLPTAASTSSSPGTSSTATATPVPLLTYHDRTPAWKISSTHGVLEMDAHQERALGVHPSFYIAVALAYLDFLTERESYLAAAAD